MNFIASPTQDDIQTALRSFLISILPNGTDVVEAQDNRVPEPADEDFVVMTLLRRERIETNRDSDADAIFTGAIAAAVLTISAVNYGSIGVGSIIFGVGVAAGTKITALGTGTGGIGTYSVTPSQTVGSRPIAAGAQAFLQPVKCVMQLDIHGPTSADNAQVISTLMRDAYGVTAFAALNPNVIPLLADDPRQMPFLNAAQQYENRWVVEAWLQANVTLTAPLQYADVLAVDVVSVEEAFPP